MLETLAGINAGVGLFNSLFGSNKTTTKSSGFDDYRNPQIMEVINQLMMRGKQGIPSNILSQMKGTQRNAIGNEVSGLRASAASRLQRQGVPVQIQEQILGDISSRGMGQLSEVLANFDMMNEQEKMKALFGAGGFSKGLTRKWTQEGTQPFNAAAGMGDSLAFLMMGQNKQNPYQQVNASDEVFDDPSYSMY